MWLEPFFQGPLRGVLGVPRVSKQGPKVTWEVWGSPNLGSNQKVTWEAETVTWEAEKVTWEAQKVTWEGREVTREGSVVCWGLIGAPGPRSEAGTPWPPSLAPGRKTWPVAVGTACPLWYRLGNLAGESGYILLPDLPTVAQELTRAAQRALEAAAAISSQSPEGME